MSKDTGRQWSFSGKGESVTLSRYYKIHHVNCRGLKYWMEKHSIDTRRNESGKFARQSGPNTINKPLTSPGHMMPLLIQSPIGEKALLIKNGSIQAMTSKNRGLGKLTSSKSEKTMVMRRRLPKKNSQILRRILQVIKPVYYGGSITHDPGTDTGGKKKAPLARGYPVLPERRVQSLSSSTFISASS